MLNKNATKILLLMLPVAIIGCATMTTTVDFKYNKLKPSNMYKGIDIDLKVNNNFDYSGNLLSEYEGLGPKPTIKASGNVANTMETALREVMEGFGIKQSEKSRFRLEVDVESYEAKFKWGTWIGNIIYKINLYDENRNIYSGKVQGYASRFNMWGLKSGRDAFNDAFMQSIDKVSWKDIERTIIVLRDTSGLETKQKKTKSFGEYGNIGVIGFEELNKGAKQENLGSILTRMIETSLYNCKKFRLIERRNLDKILIEQKFQLSGLVDDSVVQIGKIAGVDFLLIGSVSKISGEIIIDFKIINIESANVFYAGSTNAKNVNNIKDSITYLMNSL